MKDPFAIAKLINPNCDDFIEKKKLKLHDDIRDGKIMIMPLMLHKESQCTHENIDWDLKDGVEMLDKTTISIKIECTDCGKLGYGFFDFREIEWK